MRRLLTDAEIAYLKEIVPGRYVVEITKMLNEKFNLNLTVPQVQTYKQNHGLKNGVDCRFGKGHIPANKGRKQSPEVYAKCAAARFKKGHKPFNFMPVGSETVKGDGFIYVKIGTPRRWKQKHILIWEAANGPKPKGA